MNTQNALLKRIDNLIQSGNTAIENQYTDDGIAGHIHEEEYIGFKAAGLSFILKLYDSKHPFYRLFEGAVRYSYSSNIQRGLSILAEVKYEIENGWLFKLKDLVTAEIFTDFLEMSEHLLTEGYKDAAAVMIGSILEEHLRFLCQKHNVETTVVKNGDTVAKRADLLNADLKKANVYGPLEQKSVTAWLSLRNSAAHGKYTEYRIEQVQVMYQGVLDFITRIR
jgi:hypothetical protein